MPIEEIAEAVGGAIIRQVGGFVVEVTVEQVFSRHTARFPRRGAARAGDTHVRVLANTVLAARCIAWLAGTADP